jgi:hypothetical protein
VVRPVWRLLREHQLQELRSHGMRAALWSPPQPSRRASIAPGVARTHLGQLGATILVSMLAVAVLTVVSDAFWLGLDATLRPAVAAAGGILVVLAILRATART